MADFDWSKFQKAPEAFNWGDHQVVGKGAPVAAPEERSALSITPEGLGQAFKSAIGGLGNAANAATGGALNEAQARLGTMIDTGLKHSGTLFTDGAPNPYEDKSVEDLKQQNRDKIRADNVALHKAAPLTYGGADLAGSLAVPAEGVGAMVGQGIMQAVGRNEDPKHLLKDTAQSVAWSAGPAAVIKGIGALGNTKYGQALKEGENVQKYVDPNEQTDLANRVKDAIKARVQAARQAHADARGDFLDQFGNTPVDASDVSSKVQSSVGRFGPDAEITLRAGSEPTTFGAMTPGQKADVQKFTDALQEPLNAQQLYKMWDSVSEKARHYENLLKSDKSEVNARLVELQQGIKSKLHEIDPQGLKVADQNMSNVIDQSKLVSPGASDTTAESFLSTLGGRTKGNRREALDSLLGDAPVSKDIDNFHTYQSFNGQGGSGSMEGVKTIGGATIGGAIGHAVAGPMGGSIGIAVGGGLSRGPVQRAILTSAGDAFKKLGISEETLAKLPPQYQSVLSQAAQKGGRSLAITHFLLSSSDPAYQRAVAPSTDK